MSPERLVLALVWSDSLRSVLALAIGFAFAGMLASGYQLMTLRPATFGLLNSRNRNQALAAVPFLMFAAPYIIIRNIVRASRIERGSFAGAAMIAFLAGFWSLMSGTMVVATLRTIGHILA